MATIEVTINVQITEYSGIKLPAINLSNKPSEKPTFLTFKAEGDTDKDALIEILVGRKATKSPDNSTNSTE